MRSRSVPEDVLEALGGQYALAPLQETVGIRGAQGLPRIAGRGWCGWGSEGGQKSEPEQSRVAHDRSRRGGMLAGIGQEPFVQERPQVAGGLRVPLFLLLSNELQEIEPRKS